LRRGSGNTLAAAKALGRHYLGVELAESTAALARDRLAKTQECLPGVAV
jgi:DNA modification methylase